MKISEKSKKNVVLLAVFALGIGLGVLLWNLIKLPYHNSWGITGPLTFIKYNPLNTQVRFVVLIVLPALLLAIAYLLNVGGFRNVSFIEDSSELEPDLSEKTTRAKTWFFAIVLVLFAVLIALPVQLSTFDTFHDGESLGPAINYNLGQVPYKDVNFFHGLYEDPLRSVLAFKLFGKSIGATKTMQSVNKLVVFLLLTFLLYKLFQGNFLYCFTAFILFLTLQGLSVLTAPRNLFLIIPPRAMTMVAFSLTVVYLREFIKREMTSRRRLFVICFFFSFIGVASFAYSIDMGLYLFVAYLILAIVLYVFIFHRSPLRITYLASSLLGPGLAVVLLGFLLRWDFGAFFRFTFWYIPKYKELADGYLYPLRSYQGFSVPLLIACSTFWVVYKGIQTLRANAKIRDAVRDFLRQYLIEFTLLVLAIFSYRSALGRAGQSHFAYSALFTYLLTTYILIKYYFHRMLNSDVAVTSGVKKVFVCAVAVLVLVSSIQLVRGVVTKNTLAENFPLRTKDSQFVPTKWKAAIRFLKKNLGKDESFVTMTNEASWYYLVDRPSPTRFQVVMGAMPYFYQRDLVNDIKNKNVKFIIYKNQNWFNHIDEIPNEKRLPIVYKYINSSFEPYRLFGDNEIWVNKKYAGSLPKTQPRPPQPGVVIER